MSAVPTLAEWADMLDGATRYEGARRATQIIVIPDDLARQLAEDLRAAHDLVQPVSDEEEELPQ